MTSTSRPVRPTGVVVVLGGSATFLGSWAVAANRQVPDWEAQVFESVNGLPDAIWPAMWVPMQAGSFAASIVVAGTTVAVTRNRRLGLAAFAASQVGFWAAKGVKTLVDRGRPAAMLPDVQLREPADGLGYISGHAAVAFALASALAPSLPRRWAVVVYATATTVAVARVYAGVHLPLDVIGGAAFGVVLGTLSRWVIGLDRDPSAPLAPAR